MIRIGLFFLGFICSLVGNAQAPDITWQKTIGGSSDEFGTLIQASEGGNFTVGGFSQSGISGDKTDLCEGAADYWVLSLDSVGNILWQNTLGGSDQEHLRVLIETENKDFLIGGWSGSSISGDKAEDSRGDHDFWVLKINSSGGIIWQRTIGGSDYDFLNTAEQTLDGGYILGGSSYSGISSEKTAPNIGSADYWVVKLDAQGSIEWQKTIGGIQEDLLLDIKQTLDGGYLLGGISFSPVSGDKTDPNIGSSDYWVIKLDTIGGIEWQKTIGGSDIDNFRAMLVLSDGGYLISGDSHSGISGNKTEDVIGSSDYWILKLDSIGNIVWQNTIGGDQPEFIEYVTENNDMGYLLAGASLSGISGDKTESSNGSFDFWVVNLDSLGNIVWQKTIGGDGFDYLRMATKTIDGGYLLGGESDSDISGDKTEDSKGGRDYWVIKIGGNSLVSSFNDLNSKLLFEIYPNPVNDYINIVFDEKITGIVQLYQNTGIFCEQKQLANNKELQLNMQQYPVGLYHLKFINENKVFNQVIIKSN